MSSLIPKINLGTPNKRSKANMSFDSQTTANIGFVQPTMCRMLVPDSSINVKNRTLVRMSPLVNPTFGRLSQRDYFTFVRMSDVYRPWAEFLAGKPFTVDTETYIPTKLPRFMMADLVCALLANNSYVGFSPVSDYRQSIGVNSSTTATELYDFAEDIINDLRTYKVGNRADSRCTMNFAPITQVNDADSGCSLVFNFGNGNRQFSFDSSNNIVSQICNVEVPTFEDSDFTFYIPSTAISFEWSFDWVDEMDDSVTHSDNIGTNGVYIHFRLKPWAKNLRKILVGLGYGFNPFDTEKYTPFKILAFYKSWFETFMPTRNIQFTDTNTYKMIKEMENQMVDQTCFERLWYIFMNEYKDAFYYFTSPDYFSASLYNLGDNTLASGDYNRVSSPYGGDIIDTRSNSAWSSRGDNGVFDVEAKGYVGGSRDFVLSNNTDGTFHFVTGGTLNSPTTSPSSFPITSTISPLVINIAQKLFKFTNKNNVVGRSIRDYLKTHYGLDDVQMDDTMVTKINSSKIDIQFDDVMNTAASPDAFLGEYAGKGLGYKSSDTTYFTTKDFGFFICMSVIVPESGYFQGSLKENKISDKFEFFTPEFDALGFDVITRGEIKNDFDTETPDFRPTDFDTQKGFGFIPRYTHFKVGRNIVNGDLTLRSTRDGLKGYYLDKIFPSIVERFNPYTGSQFGTSAELKEPDYLPEVVSDNIRKIDSTDEIGEYNRIFQYTATDLDHFIIQKVFDVEVTAPWRSLSDSFDTIQQDESVISRNHQ